MASKQKVLINNVYSYRNRGDSAIIESMYAFIKKHYPHTEIVLLSQFWETNDPYYKKMGLLSKKQLWDIPMHDNKLVRLIIALKSLLKTHVGYLFNNFNTEQIDLYEDADLIIDAGGGSIFSSNKYFFYLGLYQHLYNLWMGKKFNKPVIVAPQSIGPLTKWLDRKVAFYVLKQLDAVIVREKISSRMLLNNNVTHELIPDVAFLANFIIKPTEHALKYFTKIDDTKINIGITVLNWSWAHQGSRQEEKLITDYLSKISGTLSKLSNNHDVKVWIFPQVSASYGDDDYIVSEMLANMIDEKIEKEIISPDCNASDFCNIYQEMDLFIGSRMHSCIFAISQGVPTLGLAYQPKTIGTFDLIDLKNYALNIESFDSNVLSQKAIEIIKNLDNEKQKFKKIANKTKQEIENKLHNTLSKYL